MGAVVVGSIYGLVGVGFALIFRATKVLSFCQGAFMLLGAFMFYDLVSPGDCAVRPGAAGHRGRHGRRRRAATYLFVFARVACA